MPRAEQCRAPDVSVTASCSAAALVQPAARRPDILPRPDPAAPRRRRSHGRRLTGAWSGGSSPAGPAAGRPRRGLPAARSRSTRSASPRMGSTRASARCSSRGWLRSDDHLTHQEAADRLRDHHAASASRSSAPATPGSDRLFYDSSYTVTAHFAQSGGIFTGAEVTYRGVGVGQVADMKLTDEGVDVLLVDRQQARQDPGRTASRWSATSRPSVSSTSSCSPRPTTGPT